MKFIVSTKEIITKYVALGLAVLLLVTSIIAVTFGVKNHKNSKLVDELEAQLVKEEEIYNEKASQYDKLNAEKGAEAESYKNELNEQKETIDKLNKKIDELNKKLAAKGEEKETTKKTENKPIKPIPSKGTKVYLTFDDGPSPYTTKILDTLDKYGVKATFFVVNGKYNKVMKDIVNRGHAIGLHTYTHDYSKVYSSDKAYFEDLQKIADVVKKETGVDTKIMRFPGGSSNTISKKYSKGIMTRLAKSVEEKGYTYFDWNCMNGDADGANTTQKQLQYCSQFPKGSKNVVVLMHDNKKATMEALPKIIEFYRDCGMEFAVLTPETQVYRHPIYN